MKQLAYVGRIHTIDSIENADRIVQARVICGEGGIWNCVVQKDAFSLSDKCLIFLQDAILPPSSDYGFMEKLHWRIRMSRFRGAISEALVLPMQEQFANLEVGTDITEEFGVTKYIKDSPLMSTESKGNFPYFIPKTDEVNYQKLSRVLQYLSDFDEYVYITQKLDGSSVTFFKKDNELRACSRNLELRMRVDSTIWKMVEKYDLENVLPNNIVIQAELVGPGIQKNPMGLSEVDIRVFNVLRINEQGSSSDYLDHDDVIRICSECKLKTVPILKTDFKFNDLGDFALLAEGVYPNGNQQEGVVVRPMHEMKFNGERVSFKIINLLYKD